MRENSLPTGREIGRVNSAKRFPMGRVNSAKRFPMGRVNSAKRFPMGRVLGRSRNSTSHSLWVVRWIAF
ncbi:hypothetical protein [Leptospira interrogans]|uniref:hypothetical protein n=1 Tax=Leptospira interrogans TaxID=173 RepID=UPI000A4B6AE8|nr:hypothetical protein [Leptospira interrogans]